MTLTQITRLLALPIGWRRRLASMPGPGWWVRAGNKMPVWERSNQQPGNVQRWIENGRAWAPADRLAWLEATGSRWRVIPEVTMINYHDRAEASDCPIDAALDFMRDNDPPGSADA